MENATKALIIAAAILIAIVLISLGVFVLGNGTQLVKENSDMTATQVTTYNSKFEAYVGDHVSGSKVKQLINLVNQHNRNAEDESKIIELTSGGSGSTTIDLGGSGANSEYTSANVRTGETYSVKVWTTNGYTSAGLIKKINIVKAN